MSTVVYLANQIVQIVEGIPGKGSSGIRKSLSLEAPEGSIINGMIMDPEAFGDFLSQTFKENKLSVKDVILVINSTKFIGRRFEIPQMKPLQVFEYIARDYADSGRGDDEMVYGFISIGAQTGKLRKIYAEGIEQEFLKDYLNIFALAGIKVKSILSGESCLINQSKTLCKKGMKTFLMAIIDGTSLIEILFVDGSFYYYNSVRCFQEIGSVEYGQDMARHVSQILQFMKSEQIEESLSQVVVAGASSVDIQNYEEAFINSGMDVKLIKYDMTSSGAGQEKFYEFFPAVSGLGIVEKYQDFVLAYRGKTRHKKYSPNFIRAVSAVSTVFVVMIITMISFISVRFVKQATLDKLDAYNNDPMIMMDAMEYDAYANRNEFLKKEYWAIKELKENIATYPCGNTTVLNEINKCATGYAEVSFSSFDSRSGIISMTAAAPLVDDINKFIKRLTESEEFCKVDYTGYQFDENTNMWNINVSCILAEGAGR